MLFCILVLLFVIVDVHYDYFAPVGVCSIAVSMSVCLCVCICCMSARISPTCPEFTKFSVHVNSGCGLVLWQQLHYLLLTLWMTSCFHTMGYIYDKLQRPWHDSICSSSCREQSLHLVNGTEKIHWILGAKCGISGCLVYKLSYVLTFWQIQVNDLFFVHDADLLRTCFET